jgi:hypothetical protein
LAKNLPFLNNKLFTFFNFFQVESIFDVTNHFWSFKPLDIILGGKGDKQIRKKLKKFRFFKFLKNAHDLYPALYLVVLEQVIL